MDECVCVVLTKQSVRQTNFKHKALGTKWMIAIRRWRGYRSKCGDTLCGVCHLSWRHPIFRIDVANLNVNVQLGKEQKVRVCVCVCVCVCVRERTEAKLIIRE